MTAQEIKTRFLILYDKVASLAAPGYEDDEISEFLNIAQDSEFLEIVEGLKKKGFEFNERRKKDLTTIVKEDILTLSTDTSTLPNGFLFDVPEEVAFVITEFVKVESNTNPCLDDKTLNILPYTHDEYRANINNPFKKPIDSGWRLDFNGKHELILPSNCTPTEYVIRYLKKPIKIDIENDVSSELGTYFIFNIINRAVSLATGITVPTEYQLKFIEEQKMNK